MFSRLSEYKYTADALNEYYKLRNQDEWAREQCYHMIARLRVLKAVLKEDYDLDTYGNIGEVTDCYICEAEDVYCTYVLEEGYYCQQCFLKEFPEV